VVGLRLDANLKWLFTELPFVQRFEAAAAAGFSGVEYADPYPFVPAELARRLADAGVEQVLLNTPMGEPGTPGSQGYACLPDEVPAFRSGVLKALDYATVLKAGLVHVVGGIVPEGVAPERAFAQYVANIAWAAEQAKGTGITLVLEAQNKRSAPGFVLAGQASAAAVVEAVGADHVGLLMDFFHLQIDEGDLSESYARFRPLIRHLQVADVPGRNEPGTGEINYRHLFRTILDSGYDGWIGCEYTPAGTTTDGLRWIEELTP